MGVFVVDVEQVLTKGPSILVRTQIFQKVNIAYPLVCIYIFIDINDN